jgi:hypothetical protein
MIGHPGAPGTERPAIDGAGNGVGPAAPLAAPDEPVVITPRRRTTTSQWLRLTLVVAVLGLAIGAGAAAVTGAAGRGGVVAATSGPAGGRQSAGAGAGADGEAGGSGRAGAAQAGAPAGAPGAPGGGQGGAGRGQGRPTTGVIASIDGDTVVLTTPDGSVSVKLSDGTSLQKQVPAARDDLAPGQRVLVSGERDADGAVAASGVQILGDGPAAGAGSGTDSGGAPGAAQRGSPPAR